MQLKYCKIPYLDKKNICKIEGNLQKDQIYLVITVEKLNFY